MIIKNKKTTLLLSIIIFGSSSAEYLIHQKLDKEIYDNFIIIENKIYDFSSHTFTTCGFSNKNIPTINSCKSSYNKSWANEEKNYTVNNGIQIWTVPITGKYSIEAYGAEGGFGARIGGAGAIMYGEFDLIKGNKIKILVGQKGIKMSEGATGGGGSFVVTEDNNPIIIAGGGGGGAGNNPYDTGKNAITGTHNSNTGSITKGGAFRSGNSNEKGAGGAGFSGNGFGDSNTWGGTSFLNGGSNGNNTVGGGGTNVSDGAGGGGGYSGGNGNDRGGAYGGGSFNSGENQNNRIGNTGEGKVIITLK